jgi:hypothetical protein
MLEDELFSHLCPHRYEHYPDFRYAFLRRLKKRLVTPGYVMIVAVENEEIVSGGLIRGYALWERIGSGPDQRNDTWTQGDQFPGSISDDSPADLLSSGANTLGSRRTLSGIDLP